MMSTSEISQSKPEEDTSTLINTL